MEILSKNDIYKLKNETLIADYDLETLVNLYEPIIGHAALSIYFTLWGVAKSYGYEVNMTHDTLFLKLHMNPGEFIAARRKLEALSLLKTWLKKGQDVNYYTYCLRAPATPKRFFENVLLAGLLQREIGETEMTKLRCLYANENYDAEGEDISSTIGEEFNPDFKDPVFKNVVHQRDDIVGRIRATANSDFDYSLFLASVKEQGRINKSAFTKADLAEINRIAQLYGIEESVMAGYVIQCFTVGAPAGKRFDFKKLNRFCQNDSRFLYLRKDRGDSSKNVSSSDSLLGKKVNYMETIPPKSYLQCLQNGIAPVNSDLNVIYDLSKQLNLKNGVINALVEFVLAQNNNILSRNYTLKIGASLAREGIETAYDAMNYLNKTSGSKVFDTTPNNVEKIETNAPEAKEKVEAVVENKQTKENDEKPSWEELMKELGY